MTYMESGWTAKTSLRICRSRVVRSKVIPHTHTHTHTLDLLICMNLHSEVVGRYQLLVRLHAGWLSGTFPSLIYSAALDSEYKNGIGKLLPGDRCRMLLRCMATNHPASASLLLIWWICRRIGTTENAGMENAGLENTGTSCVWIARRNIINVVRGCVRVVLKRMCSTSEQIA